eukprot:scaffold591_cov65-Phaeocystis_antarctica.AAC.14
MRGPQRWLRSPHTDCSPAATVPVSAVRPGPLPPGAVYSCGAAWGGAPPSRVPPGAEHRSSHSSSSPHWSYTHPVPYLRQSFIIDADRERGVCRTSVATNSFKKVTTRLLATDFNLANY